ncbi:NAD(P)-dependent oxidoreductase [Paenibacillus agricola]|uniref:NAD(P)-dependent oxidoreductase n=1 Tax=Paenibacillus agricola TaxID=2716264 RepID=A0ABX0J9R9_9BACL|nr:NAD(P)-dependent oxidoreductase [Paenibacillus agricola]NHN32511.1 NAD(P)-dependent oxidoreductase [Paenibacillus agricola]
MKNIGFIGVGIMGKSMVRNLIKNGFNVSVYTRTKSKILDVIDEGAIWCDSIKSCVENKDAVITIVGYPKDVDEVYFGSDGIIENVKRGAYVIDMTTTSPVQSKKIYAEAKQRGIFTLDAPVSGGDAGAKAGTLSIMVGGDEEAFKSCKDIFAAMGTNVIYEGGAGYGQHTKMANQIALAGAIAGTSEAIIYAQKVGLDVGTMLESISKGAAGSWQMTNNGQNILKGNYNPGFFIKHYVKDLLIAADEASNTNLDLRVLNNVLAMYKALEERGMGDLGTQALVKYFDE